MPKDLSSETLVFTGGDPLKSLEVKDGLAKVGSYAIRFSGPDSKDLTGEYFTAATDYGPRNGDGAVTMSNHGAEPAGQIAPAAQKIVEYPATKTFAPVKAVRTTTAISSRRSPTLPRNP